jgi:acyl-CoA-binding protein
MYDFVGKSKWDSWDRCKGCSKEFAKKKYIALAAEIDKTIPNKMEAILMEE